MSWSREQATTLISEYSKHPCLYAVKNKNYANKHARLIALEQIKEALKVVKKDVTINDIKNKFQGLKSTFLTEYRKYQKSFKSGAGEEDIYQPSLWYFENMLFIVEHCTVRKGTSSHDLSESMVLSEDLENEKNVDDTVQEDVNTESVELYEIQDEGTLSKVEEENKEPQKKKRKTKDKNDAVMDNVLKDATGAMNMISNAIAAKEKSHSSGFSKNKPFADFVLSKLDEISNDEIVNLVEEKITANLFEGLRMFRNLNK